MSQRLRFVIVDGYPAENRQQFDKVGMRVAAHLYRDLLLKYMPQAHYEIYFSSDPGVILPSDEILCTFHGIIWPGCNLTVYHEQDERVQKILDLVRRGYQLGVPQFGSCWGAQIAVYAAGGKVAANPKGREMGLARKIHLTETGKIHPMFKDKPPVFDGFISHDDYIVELPSCAAWLAGNDFSPVQAVAVEFQKGIFWATQYHPEYDLHEMARLIVARQKKLIKYGFFQDENEVQALVDRYETLHAHPERKDLRWQLAVDGDVLDDSVRHREFINWLEQVVIPRASHPSLR